LLGNVEFVARHGVDPEVLSDLRRDAERLGRLVDDLLVLERSSSADVQPVVVALDEVVGDVVTAHEGMDGRLDAGAVEPVAVLGDREALVRVLENLVSNALVHGPAGGKVSVALHRHGSVAELSVCDEGPGPGRGHSARVFERFWRAPEASDRPGSGLGLSIVSAIVDRHGGQISVRGSTFTVSLPIAERAADA
jgi:signal transduction histidine kinase